ncbi:unnamed protein product [Musa hybrid cultivar]
MDDAVIFVESMDIVGISVVVVESDKADKDVETFYDGYLAAIMVEEGAVAPVGSANALLAGRDPPR